MQKYTVNQQQISNLLAWVKSGEIAIPEIQRPFVWDATKVRNLMDSLYYGYPIGYIITWNNPNMRLKDGSISMGKKILIDGQQRITALTAAILGEKVVNKKYKKVRIKIAFDPINEKFEVSNPAILKDNKWVPDISEIFNGRKGLLEISREYLQVNPELNPLMVEQAFTRLTAIQHKQIGSIDLASDLDIDTVTEIFIRINSQGVVLSQADFAMSKIATNTEYGGNTLRKIIDYFAHLAVSPEFHAHIEANDPEFANTEYYQRIKWLKDENEEIYDPKYTDVLRVAFTSQFNRGRLAELVSLLSGRNFETREYEETISKDSFDLLRDGVLDFVNAYNYRNFLLIVKSAGFTSTWLLRSQNVLNFAYILFLKLRKTNVPNPLIEKYVRKWMVLSILTGRYSGSPESIFDYDVKQIERKDFGEFLTETENGDLSDAFWEVSLPNRLETSAPSSPLFHVYVAAQIKAHDKGFLSNQIKVADLATIQGDIHHIFPKNYIKKQGFYRGTFNQIANFALTQTDINIRVGSKSPKEYFDIILHSFENGKQVLTGIENHNDLMENFRMNAIPQDLVNMTFENYEDFLTRRRKLMSDKIRDFYFSL